MFTEHMKSFGQLKMEPEETMYAFIAMTDGIPVSKKEAMASPEKER